jgi:hypothetical protein
MHCRVRISRPQQLGGHLIFVGLTVTFLKQFGLGISLTSPLLVSLAAAITLLGRLWGGRRNGNGLTASIGHSLPPRPLDMATFGLSNNDQGFWQF